MCERHKLSSKIGSEKQQTDNPTITTKEMKNDGNFETMLLNGCFTGENQAKDLPEWFYDNDDDDNEDLLMSIGKKLARGQLDYRACIHALFDHRNSNLSADIAIATKQWIETWWSDGGLDAELSPVEEYLRESHAFDVAFSTDAIMWDCMLLPIERLKRSMSDVNYFYPPDLLSIPCCRYYFDVSVCKAFVWSIKSVPFSCSIDKSLMADAIYSCLLFNSINSRPALIVKPTMLVQKVCKPNHPDNPVDAGLD